MKNIRFSLLALMALVLSTGLYAQTPAESTEDPANAKTKKATPMLLTNGSSDVEAPEPETTTMEFTEYDYDFGKINQGDVVKHAFKFTNTGDFDLIIENVKPSCGCTALDWPREPIAPGESGTIEAQFNSAHKSGVQNKYITVTYNGNPRIERVSFRGEVILPEQPAEEEDHTDHTH